MLRKPYINAVHESQAPDILSVPTYEVVAQARKVARMLRLLSPYAAAQLVVTSEATDYELPGVLDLRDVISESLSIATAKYALRLSVTVDERRHNEFRRNRAYAVNNLHADFNIRPTDRGHEFFPKAHPRYTAIIDGDGSQVAVGRATTKRALEFIGKGKDTSNDFGHEMESLKPVLIGADGQIIRGPNSSRMWYTLGGDLEFSSLPEEAWCALHPTTLHESAEEMNNGRIVLNVDPLD